MAAAEQPVPPCEERHGMEARRFRLAPAPPVAIAGIGMGVIAGTVLLRVLAKRASRSMRRMGATTMQVSTLPVQNCRTVDSAWVTRGQGSHTKRFWS
jgi:hypothetical protein